MSQGSLPASDRKPSLNQPRKVVFARLAFKTEYTLLELLHTPRREEHSYTLLDVASGRADSGCSDTASVMVSRGPPLGQGVHHHHVHSRERSSCFQTSIGKALHLRSHVPLPELVASSGGQAHAICPFFMAKGSPCPHCAWCLPIWRPKVHLPGGLGSSGQSVSSCLCVPDQR